MANQIQFHGTNLSDVAMEVEAKLEAQSSTILHSLARRRRLAGYELCPVGVRDLETIYLDTPRRDLLRRGIALRIRCQARGAEVTLKLPGKVARGVHSRPEWTWKLGPRPELPFRVRPRELRDRLPVAIRDQELFPLVGTWVRRRALLVRRPGGGAPLAEIALDRVEFFEPDLRQARRSSRSYEVEVELLGGEPADLRRMVDALRRGYPLKPSRRSKFEQALRWAGIRASRSRH